jgi:hypothetical protein
MARHRGKKYRHHKAKPHIPLAIAAPVIVEANAIYQNAKGGLSGSEISSLSERYTDPNQFMSTYGKFVAGILIHVVAQKSGANRYIGKATGGYVVI